jgi:hypothetical protein
MSGDMSDMLKPRIGLSQIHIHYANLVDGIIKSNKSFEVIRRDCPHEQRGSLSRTRCSLRID